MEPSPSLPSPPAPSPAEMYEQYFVPAMFRPWSQILLGRAAPQPGEQLLDVACGTGVVAREAAALIAPGGQAVGLDMNPAMLAVARTATPPGQAIQWQQGDAMALPFAEAHFDLVLCQHGLQFFPDRVGALREMQRVLRPGGRAVLMVLQALNRHPVFEALMQSVARHLALPVAAVALPFALSDAEALRQLCLDAGFANTQVFAESTDVHFPYAEHFVPRAVTSSAAAVPAFVQLAAPERASLLRAVATDVAATLQAYRVGNGLQFHMFAHLALARR
ncbi:methyltransferase domain-containing protein [Rhodoferax sp.]|uniref:methyltransferase domain-containing protein n=1 Tax=Rhodoferax sp. TaxID=50421 RepID=UPI00374DA576